MVLFIVRRLCFIRNPIPIPVESFYTKEEAIEYKKKHEKIDGIPSTYDIIKVTI